jgi:hypothetical protein
MDDLKPWETLSYAGIARACFLIALDNGGINRGRSVRKWRGDYERWIAIQAGPLAEISSWLADLPDEQMELVCGGGEDEPETIAARADAPAFTDALLTSYFDEVC